MRELRQCDQWRDLRDDLESHLVDVSTSTSDAKPSWEWCGGAGGGVVGDGGVREGCSHKLIHTNFCESCADL